MILTLVKNTFMLLSLTCEAESSKVSFVVDKHIMIVNYDLSIYESYKVDEFAKCTTRFC